MNCITHRSLYDCMHARYPVDNTKIYCRQGHKLGDGNVEAKRLGQTPSKLTFRACQMCPDFEEIK
jgi:hypothetical protein